MCLRYNFILSVQRILLWFDHGCFYLFTWQHSKCFPFFGRGDHTICTYTCTKCYKSLYTRLCFLKLILKILKSCHQCACFRLCFPKYHNFHFFFKLNIRHNYRDTTKYNYMHNLFVEYHFLP